jgi:hypothetical protein
VVPGSAIAPDRTPRRGSGTGPSPVTIGVVEAGARIEVRARFDQRWARGFEVAEVVREGKAARYRVRRRSDGSILPVLFVAADLREERTRSSMWWM